MDYNEIQAAALLERIQACAVERDEFKSALTASEQNLRGMALDLFALVSGIREGDMIEFRRGKPVQENGDREWDEWRRAKFVSVRFMGSDYKIDDNWVVVCPTKANGELSLRNKRLYGCGVYYPEPAASQPRGEQYQIRKASD